MTSLEAWHSVIENRDLRGLDSLLADDVVLHSPVVHTPIAGKPTVRMYLAAALQVFANDSFRYVREVVGEREAVLEFETLIDGITVNGVDMIRWDEAGRIVDFKVMVRPLKAIQLIHQKMAELVAGPGRSRAGETP